MRRRSLVVRCCICRQANAWGGRKLAVLIEHGTPSDCVLGKPHCRGCCVKRPAADIERERREAEILVNYVMFGKANSLGQSGGDR
jgi:hypothetical protein